MKRLNRLTSSRDFARVMRNGARGRSSSVVCIVVRSEEQRAPRVGLAVPGAFGGAVARNRAKRVLREAVRPILRNMAHGADAVLIPKPALLDRSLAQIRADVRQAISEAGIAW